MEQDKRPVWVIGHKNPDTDSICAAIAYANLKNKTEKGTFLPKKAGPINEETKYVLNTFHVPEPETVSDVSTQISDLSFRRTAGVSDHYSLKKAWELMKSEDVVTLPIVNSDNFLEGVIVNGDIAYSYMDVYDNRALSRARTQYKNIVETLNGHLLVGNEHAYFTRGKVVVASGNREAIRQEIDRDDLVILGNIIERQHVALEQIPSCMIVTGVSDAAPQIRKEADAIDCVLITTEYDSYTAARLINQSMPIKYFMKKDHLVTFELDDSIDYVRDIMSKVRHRDFPVLDEHQKYVGMFSRRNLLNMQKKRVILVDHNERTQAVDGIDEAEILEIIDHHRLGTLETLQPIFFRNQPLGCSSTIIYQMYLEQDVLIDPVMAGLMLSAILSDTLMFRSPTSTAADEEAGKALAEIAGVDLEKHAIAMFEAGSNFQSKTVEEIVYGDFKIFHYGDIHFGVSQVSAVSENQLMQIRPALTAYLDRMLIDKGLDMVFIMLTNILEQGSLLIYAGNNAELTVQMAFEHAKKEEGACLLPGVVSRKKQLIPKIIEALQNQ